MPFNMMKKAFSSPPMQLDRYDKAAFQLGYKDGAYLCNSSPPGSPYRDPGPDWKAEYREGFAQGWSACVAVRRDARRGAAR